MIREEDPSNISFELTNSNSTQSFITQVTESGYTGQTQE